MARCFNQERPCESVGSPKVSCECGLARCFTSIFRVPSTRTTPGGSFPENDFKSPTKPPARAGFGLQSFLRDMVPSCGPYLWVPVQIICALTMMPTTLRGGPATSRRGAFLLYVRANPNDVCLRHFGLYPEHRPIDRPAGYKIGINTKSANG